MHSTSYNHTEDTTLWNQVTQGDMSALSVLYKRHYELLLNFGLKFISDEEIVKDCIQDLFVKICSSKRLAPTEYVRSYLLTSLKHVLIDKMEKLQPTEEIEGHSFQLAVEDDVLERLFSRNDKDLALSRRLMAAYRALPENQRMAVYLRFVRGFSFKEMAAMMQINAQSSMNLIQRALANLRSHLSPNDFRLMMLLLTSKWMLNS